MAKLITVTIEKGKVTADATGFHGKGCAESINKLLAVLGGKTLEDVNKVEYNKPVQVEQGQKARR